MSFRLVPKSVTLNDLERRNGRYIALFHWRCRKRKRNLCKSLLYFLVRVQCRRKESSRSLSHLLMSFLFVFIVYEEAATRNNEATHNFLKVPSLNFGALAVPREPKNSGAATAMTGSEGAKLQTVHAGRAGITIVPVVPWQGPPPSAPSPYKLPIFFITLFWHLNVRSESRT